MDNTLSSILEIIFKPNRRHIDNEFVLTEIGITAWFTFLLHFGQFGHTIVVAISSNCHFHNSFQLFWIVEIAFNKRNNPTNLASFHRGHTQQTAEGHMFCLENWIRGQLAFDGPVPNLSNLQYYRKKEKTSRQDWIFKIEKLRLSIYI